MTAPLGSAINHQVAEFAWCLKNQVRPLGLMALGLPCQLMGTGMAFPWDILRSAELANGFIAEDLKLGLDLAAAGHPPVFCPEAIVKSTFPTSAEGSASQRQRWEHGHVGLILTKAPRLLYVALREKNLNALALALDLLVPPLSLFGILLGVMTSGTAIATLVGASAWALLISLSCLVIMVATIVLAWVMFGRQYFAGSGAGIDRSLRCGQDFALTSPYCSATGFLAGTGPTAIDLLILLQLGSWPMLLRIRTGFL